MMMFWSETTNDLYWLIHILAILIILMRHLLSLVTALRYFQEIQSSLGVDESLYLIIVFLNSSLEKDKHSKFDFKGSLSKRLKLIW